MSDQNGNSPTLDGVSRRSFLGVGSVALVTVAMTGLTAHAAYAAGDGDGALEARRRNLEEDPFRKAGNHRRMT